MATWMGAQSLGGREDEETRAVSSGFKPFASSSYTRQRRRQRGNRLTRVKPRSYIGDPAPSVPLPAATAIFDAIHCSPADCFEDVSRTGDGRR